LWFAAPYIASFFDQPQLIWLTRIMGLDIVFKAISIVQRAVITQSLRFRLLSTIDISVSILTGIIAIFLAYKGLGVWALAIKYFLSSLIVSIIFFVVNPWMPSGFINKNSFDRLFGFGSKLLVTGMINMFFNNIYNLVIGKLFSPEILGFYDRAMNFYNQSISTVLIAVQQVTYPILSKVQDDPKRLKMAHQKLINVNAFINFPIATILFFTAEPIIAVLLGDKWLETIPFLQFLSLSGLIAHLGSLNNNLFKVIGRSDLFLKISIISKIVTVLAIVIGVQYGIWGLVISSIISQYITAIIVMYFITKQIAYSLFEQLKDFLRSILLIVPMICIMIILFYTDFNSNLLKLFALSLTGMSVYILTAYLSKSIAFAQIIELIKPYIIKNKKA
jgi:O-antigen/teichoic acid export membrane protein